MQSNLMSTPTKRYLAWHENSVDRKVRKALDSGELEDKKAQAIREEAEKKKKKEEEATKKKNEQAMELGLKLMNFGVKDIEKTESLRSSVACRGEDLASNVYQGLSQLKKVLGKAARGTIFDNVTAFSSALLGVSLSSASVRSKPLKEPSKARKGRERRITRKELRKRAADKLSADDKKEILAHLQECWKSEKHVSLDTILEWAKSAIGFPYGKTTLSYVLGGMGLCFRLKRHNPIVEERKDLVILREKYLKFMEYLREQNSYLSYFDETWVFEGMVSDRGWQIKDDTMYNKARLLSSLAPVPGPKKGASRGRRGIVAAVLTVDGVLKGSEQVWVSSGKLEDQTEDYHKQMNHVLYENYMKTKVIPNLIKAASAANQQPVLIIDNAPYHNRYLDKAPVKSDKKAIIIDWLTAHGVFAEKKMKKDLLVQKLEDFIEQQGGRSVFKKYVVDEYARAKGVRVVRLPPYHCFLSPIELLWSQLKQSVMKAGTTSTPLSEVRKTTLQFLRAFSAENSKKLFEKIAKLEREVTEKLKERESRNIASTSTATPTSPSSEKIIKSDDSGDFDADFEEFLQQNENQDDFATDDVEEAEALEEIRIAVSDAKDDDEEIDTRAHGALFGLNWLTKIEDHIDLD